MTEFNFGQNVNEVGTDPLQVEHALVLQGIRRMEQQSARLRSHANPTLGAGKSASAPPPKSGARAPAGSEPDARARDRVEAISIEDRCQGEWSQSAELRSEFSSVEQYTAYMKAAQRGQARIFGQQESRRSGSRREHARPEGPSAETLIQQWKREPATRAEFLGDFSRFAAFQTAAARGLTPARE